MKDKFGSARPYSAAYVIFRRNNKVALVLRGNLPWMAHHYGLAAGKVEIGETFTEAAIREAKEEVGVQVRASQLKQVLTVHRYSVDIDSVMEWVDVLFEAIDWDGEVHNAEPHMHDAVEWHDVNHLPENTIPAIRAFLQAVEKGKHYLEYGWENRK